MTQMVRKQIYLDQHHNALLKQLAKARQVSEAEVVQQALEHEAASPIAPTLSDNRAALAALLESARARRQFTDTGPAYRWKREEAYEEREARFDKFSHPELDA